MTNTFRTGDAFQVDGREGKVLSFIGEGGQGEVYRVSLGSQELAFKWYFPQNATDEQRRTIKRVVATPPPSTAFLWPLGLAETPSKQGFGYVMRLRPKHFSSINDLHYGRVTPTFETLVRAGYNLAAGYGALHRAGLCYKDISHGNVFFDARTGEALICDCDNVTDATDATSAVDGTPKYMAPEIVLGAQPTVESDLYSLGVLLFQLFMMNHPLHGKLEHDIRVMNPAAMRRLYGEDPVFIFDPKDARNRPVYGDQLRAQVYWDLYPAFFRDQFTNLFTRGLKDPTTRAREGRWEQTLAELLDAVLPCSCGAENFYDKTRIEVVGKVAGQCWHCKQGIPLPPRLKVAGNRIVALTSRTKLYRHHLRANAAVDLSQAEGEISQHPKNGAWGIRNLTGSPWTFTRGQSPTQNVDPGQSVQLSPDLRIECGGVEVEVRL